MSNLCQHSRARQALSRRETPESTSLHTWAGLELLVNRMPRPDGRIHRLRPFIAIGPRYMRSPRVSASTWWWRRHASQMAEQTFDSLAAMQDAECSSEQGAGAEKLTHARFHGIMARFREACLPGGCVRHGISRYCCQPHPVRSFSLPHQLFADVRNLRFT